MRVLIICPTSENILTFRRNLIEKLQSKGCEVAVVCFDEQYLDEIKQLNVCFYRIDNSNRGMNPLKLLKLTKQYKKIVNLYKPDIVFTFQLKPNIFGTVAAKKCGIKRIYSMVEGAGDPFIHNSLKWRIIRAVVCILYKNGLKHSKKVFFLNSDDAKEFKMLKIVKKEQIHVIHGIGVDLERFSFKNVNAKSNSFLMIARMLETKGIWEYIRCAELVKKIHPEAQFNYLGAEGTVKIEDIQPYISNGTINYLGTAKDVRPFLEDSLLLILLSSYREGLPMSVMEAESSGRGVIVSNNVGCKDTVLDGYNGFLIEQKDYETMAKKCIQVLENKQMASEFGKNARKFAEENFDQNIINQTIVEVLSI